MKKLILIPFVILLSSTLATGAPPDHAKGAPPQKFYMVDLGGPFDDTSPYIDCDGFSTNITLSFGGFWMTHPANAGKGLWEFYHSDWPVTIANADDETLFVEGIPGQVMNRHWTGEPFASDPIETGVQIMIVLPGHGVIYRNVGRVIIDLSAGSEDLPFTFIAGQWDFYDEDYQALCAALTP